LDSLFAPADGFQIFGNLVQGLHVFHAVEGTGIDQDTFLHIGFCHGLDIKGLVGRLNDHDEREIVFFGEFKVPLVVGRHRHDATRAVIGEDEIGGVDRHPLFRHRVQTVGVKEDTLLFVVVRGAHDLVMLLDLVHPLPDLSLPILAFDKLQHQGVLGGDEHESGPEDGVLAGCKHLDVTVAVRHGKGKFAAVALADPVPLHGEDPLRPAGEAVAVCQQLLHVGGDPEEPLVKFPGRHLTGATPA